MKSKFILTLGCSILISFSAIINAVGQSGFRLEDYLTFVNHNKNLEADEFLQRFRPDNDYFTIVNNTTPLNNYLFLDSITEKYELSKDELKMLHENRFLVTERLRFGKMPDAMIDIYNKDLPIFISSDAILDALHLAYSTILMQTEEDVLSPGLMLMTDILYDAFPKLMTKYSSVNGMQKSLEDVDLYITVLKNLSGNDYYPPYVVSKESVDNILDAIRNEQFISIPLFTEILRKIDFSQFKVRGHYTKSETLGKYFKCMMWLGRTEFVLANAPKEWYDNGFNEDGLKRLNMSAMMLNEIMGLANVDPLLNEINDVLEVLVGESDNLRPNDFSNILEGLEIHNASDLLADDIFQRYQEELLNSPEFNQQILSSFVLGDPEDGITAIPFSFYLLGQRYIIDSHIFSKVVFDNIVYHEEKMYRMMPDPLDAMFALGNDNALPLLSDELEQWHYSSQLAAMRYLVDSHDKSFWDKSFYNCWLNSIRQLNPSANQANLPLFMQTVAWQQEKLNTQLASWSQLRHDNILYAKQSFTPGAGCSFPHSYVEPYPAFYLQIANLAYRAAEIEVFKDVIHPDTEQVASEYFQFLGATMETLATIAQKELDGVDLDNTETDFLQKMIHQKYLAYDGWFIKLLFGSNGYDFSIPGDDDYIVADIHTQPTDRYGITVGKVLHVGTGKINLGVFLAESPSADSQPMAFVGPVLSYYEKITDNFQRLNDQDWGKMVITNNLPERPDWVNVYLADSLGNQRAPGRELSGVIYTGFDNKYLIKSGWPILEIYPNPVSERAALRFQLSKNSNINIGVYNITGQCVESLYSGEKPAGVSELIWNTEKLPGGIYFIRLTNQEGSVYSKIIKR